MPPTETPSRAGVVIDPAAFYDLPALRRMEFGTQAIRSLRRKAGLVVRRSGRKSWVEGADLIAAIKRTGTVVS